MSSSIVRWNRRMFLQASFFLPIVGGWSHPFGLRGQERTLSDSASASPFFVQEFSSPRGIPLWLSESGDTPVFALSFSFSGGSSRDPHGLAGLANFLSDMLTEGAGELDSATFRLRLENFSVGLRFSASRDFVQGQLVALSDRRREAFDLLALALSAPRFEQAALERNRQQILDGIRRRSQSPNGRAMDALFQGLFSGDPYALSPLGTPESVGKIHKSSLESWKNRWISRESSYISAAGAITSQQLGEEVDRAFGDLPTQEHPSLSNAEPNFSGETIHTFRDIPQSFVVGMQSGLPMLDERFPTLQVLNQILGGPGFSSRLYTRIREERGLVYLVSSWVRMMKRASLLGVVLGTERKNLEQSLDLLREIWSELAQEGPKPEEITLAQQYLTGSFALRFQNSPGIADFLTFLRKHNVPLSYLQTRNRNILAVTQAQLHGLGKQILRPDKMTFSIAGRT